jgi:acyl-CoA thioester hydrolase
VIYLEQAGVGSAMTADHLGPFLAQVTCNYRRQINYPDQFTIGARITKIGNTSFSMAHAVGSESQQTSVADGDSVVVVFDFQSQRPTRVPDELSAAIASLEGGSLK